MTAFGALSSLVRGVFALWAFGLCITGIVGAVLAIARKRYLLFSLALILFAPVYFIWQVVFDRALSGRGIATITAVTRTLCDLPWLGWVAVLLIFTVAEIVLLGYEIRYEKNHITPNSIKVYLDKMPCGVCCWRENGRVLFSNICMNRLCLSLTDGPLRNGDQFYEAVKDGIVEVDGKMWRFSCRELPFGGETCRELIASDVTAAYAKTRKLEKDKSELSRINRELREYTLGIDETVRRQEILQAKVNIHDEMNKLMLSTMAAEDDAEKLDRIFSLWEQNALLLCMEADETEEESAMVDVERLAEALKIRLIREGNLPATLTDKQKSLFFAAARESVANAAKHAQAKTMTISFAEEEGKTICRFTSDGIVPDHVTFSGGLSNLSRLAEKQGATVSAFVRDEFTLEVRFPTGNKPIG